MGTLLGQRRYLSRLGFVLGMVAPFFVTVTDARADGATCDGLANGAIRWIVPFSPGGASDTFSRLFAHSVEQHLQRGVLVDNIKGAGGLIGSKGIRDSDADGMTVGVVNAGGLMVANFLEVPDAPDPIIDYKMIGRIANQRNVWVVAQNSPIVSLSDISSADSPYVMGYQDIGSASYIASAVSADLAGIDLEFVAGYKGSKQRLLAIQRGELDLSAAPFETYLAAIEAGDVRPVLQISEERISDHPSLAGVPLLRDVAIEHAATKGRTAESAISDIEVIGQLIGAVPIVVAPAGLPDGLLECWRSTFDAVVADPEFLASIEQARRTLAPLSGADVEDLLATVAARVEPFALTLKARIEEAKD